jgi:glucosyl-3-phosphoglycerate synthase
VVKTHHSPELGKPTAPHAEDERLSETVDRWFAQNTFHYREFRGMSSLTLLKDQNNLSVSLIIPVYGQIPLAGLAENVRRTRFALMRDCALIDEIIISSCNMPFSPKETALFIPNEEAKADITIIHSESPVPGRLGNGPGEALWQAMRKVRGDIVVWADPGASTFEARFIYGLIGPLLNYPKFMMACGFFSEGDEPETRPVLDNLTEISIRPLLGGFFPRLAGFINPISLVGAARREHLERVPFFTESGFMTGLIIDTLARKGLLSMVQIDLGAATPRVSELIPQRVTAEIVSVLLRRIEERTQTHLVNLLNPSVKTVQKANGVYSLKVTPSTPLSRELPPPLYTPGYYRNSF